MTQNAFTLAQYRLVSAQVVHLWPLREQLAQFGLSTGLPTFGAHNIVKLLNRPGSRRQLLGIGLEQRKRHFGGQRIPAQQQGATVLLKVHEPLHMGPVLIALRLAAEHHNGVQQLLLAALADQAGQPERTAPLGQVIDGGQYLGLRVQLERQAHRPCHKCFAPREGVLDFDLQAVEKRQHIIVAVAHQPGLHGWHPALLRSRDSGAQGLQVADVFEQGLRLLQGRPTAVQQSRHFADAFLVLQLAFLRQILMDLNQCLRIREIGQLRHLVPQIRQPVLELKPRLAHGDDVLQGEQRTMFCANAEPVSKAVYLVLGSGHL